MICGDPACGEPAGRGHPRTGWIRWHVAGTGAQDTWWCSARCAAAGHGVRAADGPPPATTLEDLNRVAGGPRLTPMTATPARIRAHLDRAFARLVADVDAQARRDAAGRPTTAVLLAEAAGEQLPTRACTRCGLEKPADEFYLTDEDRLSSWCKRCSALAAGERAAAS